jgi:hypothetical protein
VPAIFKNTALSFKFTLKLVPVIKIIEPPFELPVVGSIEEIEIKYVKSISPIEDPITYLIIFTLKSPTCPPPSLAYIDVSEQLFTFNS